MQTMIEERVRKLLVEVLDYEGDINSLKPDENLNNFGIDSILFIKLIVLMELEFGFEVEDEKNLGFDKMNNIKSIVEYIQSKDK